MKLRESRPGTQVTTLENGIKVASEESFGQFSTVGGKYIISCCIDLKINENAISTLIFLNGRLQK